MPRAYLRGRVLAWHYPPWLRLTKETDVERLRQAALLLEAENRRLVARVVELTRS